MQLTFTGRKGPRAIGFVLLSVLKKIYPTNPHVPGIVLSNEVPSIPILRKINFTFSSKSFLNL